jgi:hypothetical protein
METTSDAMTAAIKLGALSMLLCASDAAMLRPALATPLVMHPRIVAVTMVESWYDSGIRLTPIVPDCQPPATEEEAAAPAAPAPAPAPASTDVPEWKMKIAREYAHTC